MNLNTFMHPRNPYRNRPDFKELAIKFPEFRKHVTQDLSGKVKLDFKDLEALRILTQTLLKKDFQLDVTIPENRLIPTLPSRLNYLLWIEDLLALDDKAPQEILGIDIGTGATCIYPLLGCKKNGWKFLATETDEISIASALSNVQRNGLSDHIEVRAVPPDSTLLDSVKTMDAPLAFCMCNPPFFSNKWDDAESQSSSRSPVNPGCTTEKVVDGGEVAFVQKIINDSLELKDKIRIYTTMLGRKSSVQAIKSELSAHDEVQHVTTTEFCQGKTIRWAIAWTFVRNIALQKVCLIKKKKTCSPMTWKIPILTSEIFKAIAITETKILALLKELEIDVHTKLRAKRRKCYIICAQKNTWIHQRRKYRALYRQQQDKANGNTHPNGDPQPFEKRLLEVEDDADNSAKKKIRLDESLGDPLENSELQLKDGKHPVEATASEAKSHEKEDSQSGISSTFTKVDATAALKCELTLKLSGTEISLELLWLEGHLGRNGVGQLMQYFKNNLK